ncbi:MAG: phosphoribosylanthranilate isomerase [Candidatus Marinimicrobia bacterium]|nr:phosphoribosylanthranilate isomerase [Candidatus Neomarinimicrobiota bacterium]|tara:strand:- start:14 stop:658 length:645 start_codon:yes stop_codon:yes gene_type:complete
MIPTKICGITNFPDAECAVNYGAAAIGFIFYEKSPRYISIEKAKSISNELPDEVSRIGVFVNHEKSFINEIVESVPLNMVQFHGNESPEFCCSFDLPVIKAFRIKDDKSISTMDAYKVEAFLLDTYSKNYYGGTGQTFDWTLLKNNMHKSIILSGGLSLENILDAINLLNPSAVDVNSGLELSPGIKDHSKIIDLFNLLRKMKQIKKYANLFKY